jgi:hypothetical protein
MRGSETGMSLKGSPKKIHLPLHVYDKENLSNFITQMYATHGVEQNVCNPNVFTEN